MRAWYSRLAIALLSISLMKAGVAACCWTTEEMNAGGRHDCHHMPRSSRVACASTDAVKGVSVQSTTSRDRGRVAGPDPVNSPKATSPVSVITAARDARETAPSPRGDLFLRIHVLLI